MDVLHRIFNIIGQWALKLFSVFIVYPVLASIVWIILIFNLATLGEEDFNIDTVLDRLSE